MGQMQLMAETARELGEKDPLDPAQNVDGACAMDAEPTAADADQLASGCGSVADTAVA